MWQAFWRTTKPQNESVCRNRLVDYISEPVQSVK